MGAEENKTTHIVSVNISEKKGTIKRPVSEINLTGSGVLGDAHSGSWHRQVSMLASESINKFSSETGRQIQPGEFAENITTIGIDFDNTAFLDRFRIGSAELEVTQIGKACHGDKCSIYQEIGKCIMPKEGIFCRVIEGGNVKSGDEIKHIPVTLRFLIITLSDRVSQGKYSDRSGPEIKHILENYFRKKPWRIQCDGIVLPDAPQSLKGEIKKACEEGVDIIFTTGGTGIGQHDITPDVVSSMADRIIPGIMEHIRIKYGEKNPKALLSRSIAGLIGRTFVYTLPGSVKAVREYMEEILKTLEHGIFMLNNIDVHHNK